MFGFWIGPWIFADEQIGWAAIREGEDELDFEVLRFWEAA